jgi:hypothetical protein
MRKIDYRKGYKKYNLEIGIESWSIYLKSKNHLENAPNQNTKLIGNTKLCKNVICR